MRRRSIDRASGPAWVRQGFTLVELLVVMVIIITLLSAVLVGSSVMVNRAKSRSTQSVLSVVLAAVDQFKNEQSDRPTITRARQGGVSYQNRYGLFPPDELEVFTAAGLPGASAGNRTLAPGGAAVKPDPRGEYPDMLFYSAGNEARELEHRDLAAMVLAIELNSEVGGQILAKLAANNRDNGPVNAAGEPLTFLHRGGGNSWDPTTDQRISYILDGWGVPLAYFAQRDFDCLFARVGRIKKTKLNSPCMFREDREIHAGPVPSCPEWIGPTRPDAQRSLSE